MVKKRLSTKAKGPPQEPQEPETEPATAPETELETEPDISPAADAEPEAVEVAAPRPVRPGSLHPDHPQTSA